MKADVCIQNGTIIDGSGAPARTGTLTITDGTIRFVDQPVPAVHTIDAEGLIVAPGFIDIHTHSDLTLLIDSRGASKVSQGITTEIVGNCGMSSVVCCEERKAQIRESATFLYGDMIDWPWSDYKEYFGEFEKYGVSMNVGAFAGHGTIRASVMGYDNRRPTREEMERMKSCVAEAMEAGALGLSSGLIYSPGVFAEPEEIVELCKVVARYGGVYTTHMRNESDGLLDSIEESLHVAREAGVSLQISHLKATGQRNWGRVKEGVERIRKARDEGIDVHYDFYPYHASSTNMSYLLPPWVQEGGWAEAKRRILEPTLRERMVADIVNGTDGWMSPSWNAGWDRIMVASVQSESNRGLEGLTLQQVAEKRVRSEPEAMLDLLVEEEGGVGMVLFVMSEADIQTAAAGEWSIVGSDGLALAADGPLSRSKPHPRSYGSFPRVFRKYCRDAQILTLEQAIHKMTGLPARKLKLLRRGLVQDGYAADLVLFDPERIRDTATFERPHAYAEGIHSVYVNGALAFDRGRFLDPKSGLVVRPALLGTAPNLG
ncbi:D-aminoacylase [Paenibacillus sp. TRM 82003]|nr:D-aminoacylase [Paenibacillus sp. TRM 82003]